MYKTLMNFGTHSINNKLIMLTKYELLLLTYFISLQARNFPVVLEVCGVGFNLWLPSQEIFDSFKFNMSCKKKRKGKEMESVLLYSSIGILGIWVERNAKI